MGATAAVFTGTGMTLVERINAYRAEHKISISALADMVHYSRPTLTQYLGGKYSSDPTNVEAALVRFLEENGAAEPQQETQPQVTPFPTAKFAPTKQSTGFIKSRDARSVFGVCQACQQDGRMGVVLAPSGFGKSFSLKQYAKLPNVAYIECNVFWGPRDLVKRIEMALGIPARVGTVSDHMQVIVDFLTANKDYLLIIDEADKLISKYAQQKIEVIRGIFDNAPVGIVLAGELKLKTQLEVYLPQTENRTLYGCELHGLNSKEVNEYLSPYNIENDVLGELHGRAYGRKKSCFRLLEGTMAAVLNDLNEARQNTVTMDIYQRATSNMLIK